MSVRIVKQDSAKREQGLRVSRRAFLAQSTALMVAMGIPVKQAKALAGKLYQNSDKAVLDGFVDEAIFSLTSRVTHAFDADEHASIQLLAKKMYSNAGLPEFALEVDWSTVASAKNPVSELAGGRSLDQVTVGEVLGRAVAPQVAKELDESTTQALAKIGQHFELPREAKSLLTDGFSVARLRGEGKIEETDPIAVFENTESVVMQRLTAGLPRSSRFVQAKAGDRTVSVPLADKGAAVKQALADAATQSWLSGAFSEEEYAVARKAAEKLTGEAAAKLTAVRAAGESVLRAQGVAPSMVNTVLAKSAELTANPAQLVSKLESRLDGAQKELTDSLDRFETLTNELSGFPLQFSEKVPEQRYILSDSGGGADELLAQEMVNELNQHHKRAEELAQEIVNLQIQVEDLSVDAYDEELFGGKFAELSKKLETSVAGIGAAVSALQDAEPSLASVSTDDYTASLEDAVVEVHQYLEGNKDNTAFEMSPREWALTKAYVSQMAIQTAQVDAILDHVSGIADDRPALAEALNSFGRWHGHAPVDNLGAMAKEQLNAWTHAAGNELVKFASSIESACRAGLAGSATAQREASYGQIIGAYLSEMDAAFEKPVSAFGGDSTTVGELVAAVQSATSKLTGTTTLNEIGSDALAAVVSAAVAAPIVEAAQSSEALKETLGKMSPAEVGASSVHYLAFEVAKGYLKQPVSDSLRNYCNTLMHGAMGAQELDLAGYVGISEGLASEAKSRAEKNASRLAAARPGLAQATGEATEKVAAEVLPVVAAQAQQVLTQQAQRALGINLA